MRSLARPAGGPRRAAAGLPLLPALLAILTLAQCRERAPRSRATNTAPPLGVEAVLPRGTTPPRGSIDVVFDRPMVRLGERAPSHEAGRKLLEIGPEPPGTYQWIGTRTLSFMVPGGLPGATAFHARVPAGVAALDGSRLREDVAWEFTTPRPEVLASIPAAGDSLFRPGDPLVLLFNAGVDPQAVARAATLEGTTGFDASRPDSTLLAQLDPRFWSADPERLVALLPRSDLSRDHAYALVLGIDLRARTGPLGPSSRIEIPFRTHGDAELLGAGAEGAAVLVLRFRTPVDADSARAYVVLEPESRIAGGWTNGTLVYLNGEFGFEKTYTLTVRAGLPDLFGQRLPAARTVEFTTGRREPTLELLPTDAVLLPAAPRTVALVHCGLEGVRLRVAALGVRDEIRSRERPLGPARRWALDRRFAAASDPGQLQSEDVDLRAALPRSGLGAVVVEATARRPSPADEEREWSARAVLRWSDLGLAVKSSPENGRAWVTRLASAAPVPRAALRILDQNAAELWKGRTDESGMAALPGLRELGRDPWQLTLVAASGADTATSSFAGDWRLEPWRFGIPGAYGSGGSDHRAFLYSDRDLYRPGETMRIAALVRRLTGGGLAAATVESVRVSVRDPLGATFAERSVALDRAGGFAFDLPTTAASKPGRYAIDARVPARGGPGATWTIGTLGLQIAAFRAASFRTSVRPAARRVGRGGAIDARIEGAYWFGAPLAGAPWSLSAVREAYAFRPQGFDEFSFWDPDLEVTHGGPVHSSTGVLDDAGNARVRIALPPELPSVPQAIQIEATVRDPSGDAVSGRSTVLYLPAVAYAGVAVEPSFVDAGGKATARIVAVRSDTALAAPGMPLDIELVRFDWRAVRKLLVGGRIGYETARVDSVIETRAATSAADPIEVAFAPQEAGSYAVRVRVRAGAGPGPGPASPVGPGAGGGAEGAAGPAATAVFYVAGSRPGAWQPSDATRLELTTDRKIYRVGDVARVLVTTPVQAKQLWLTVEREGVLESRLVAVADGPQVVEIPVVAAYLPNVYVGIAAAERALASREAPGLPEPARLPRYALGYAPIRVEIDSRRLAVAVRTDREEHQPGERIVVELEVQDATSRGVPARLGVAVVDEAVLALLGTPVPDPFGFFYAERPLAVDNRDTRLGLSAGSRLEAAQFKGEAGGDGAEKLAARSLFTTTAYWNPAVDTDAEGRARVEFTLPDNLTSFRIVALAASGADRFGTGTGSFRVAKPLTVEPALPRFALAGDTLDVAAVVTNRGRSALRGRVRLETDLEALGPLESPVELPAGASRRVAVRATAAAAGAARVRFEARFPNATDAVETKLVVDEPVIPKVAATAAHTDRVATESVAFPAGARSGTVRLDLVLASSALVGARPAIDYVLDYPFACLEQLSSRLVVLIAARRLFATTAADSARFAADVEETVRRIEAQALGWGGFSFWRGGPEAPPWMSAWATFALGRAARNGFAVTPAVLEGARFALVRHWREAEAGTEGATGSNPRSGESEPAGASFAGLSLLALAEMQRPEPGGIVQPADIDRFAAAAGRLATDERLFLSLALQTWRTRRDVVLRCLEDVLGRVEVTAAGAVVPQTADLAVAEPFRTTTRTTSLALWLAAGARPGDPIVPRLATGLLSTRVHGHWGTTQDDALALLALETYRDGVEAAGGDVQAECRPRGAASPLVVLAAPAGSAMAQSVTLPLPTGPGQAVLEFATRGMLHYAAVLRWDEDARRQPPDETGYTIVRRVERYEAPGPLRLGDLAVVTLQIVVPRESWYLAVVDPLPAGLEIVHSDFVVESQQVAALFERWRGEHDPLPVSHVERGDRELRLFADRVPAGVYEHRYVARVRAAGGFAHLPARVEAMYAPELHASTAAGRWRARGPAKGGGR